MDIENLNITSGIHLSIQHNGKDLIIAAIKNNKIIFSFDALKSEEEVRFSFGSFCRESYFKNFYKTVTGRSADEDYGWIHIIEIDSIYNPIEKEVRTEERRFMREFIKFKENIDVKRKIDEHKASIVLSI